MFILILFNIKLIPASFKFVNTNMIIRRWNWRHVFKCLFILKCLNPYKNVCLIKETKNRLFFKMFFTTFLYLLEIYYNNMEPVEGHSLVNEEYLYSETKEEG